jgi:hypothetical protein
MATTKITWTRKDDGIGGHEYVSSNGARVYCYGRKAYATEWGVQMAHEATGGGGFRTMREAKEFVEKHSR